jgi:hypothetical protein
MNADRITDARESMRKVTSLKSARCGISHVRDKLEDARFIRWPALVESFQREHDDAVAIAAEKGFAL